LALGSSHFEKVIKEFEMRRLTRVKHNGINAVTLWTAPPERLPKGLTIKHYKRKVLGNEWFSGMVLYKGTITRRGVRALELRDVEM
jgi:hypothetical protein